MSLFHHSRPPAESNEPAGADVAVAPPDPLERWRTERGTDFCSARGCRETTGVACQLIDRHGRACPTAWCPEHRSVLEHGVLCPSHAALLEAVRDPLSELVMPDVGNRIPNMLINLVHQVDADLTSLARDYAERNGQTVVIEPVRFSLVGVTRTRTWERAWKGAAHLGVTLRMAVAIEEAAPKQVSVRLNSKPLVSLRLPSYDTPDDDRRFAVLGRRVVSDLRRAVAAWEAEPEPAWLHRATRAEEQHHSR